MTTTTALVLVASVALIGAILIVVRRAGIGAPKTQQTPDQVAKS